MIIHVVKPGETAYSIAKKYGVSPESVVFNNQLYLPSELAVGQSLLILIAKEVHQVRRGETLYSIARQYGLTVKQLIRNNPYVMYQNHLFEGEFLVIRYQENKKGKMSIGGFAYPFIKQEILYETIPYLTNLLIFSYGFQPDGSLIGIKDESLLMAAKEFGVRPILVLTGSNEKGDFDSHLISIALNDKEVQNQLISNLLTVMKRKQYVGIDIDFESVLPEDKEAYVVFLKNISQIMHSNAFSVSIDLSPKETENQKGLLYEGLDYAGLGRYADSVLIMTYEWGYAYSEPMAVAPINSVRTVMEYALSVIPSKKLSLGMPNYGYEWPLPYVEGQTKARSVGNVEAQELAMKNHAVIQFDSVAMTPHFQFTQNKKSYEIWFEDVRSIQAKANLALEFKLENMGYWNIMRTFRANWLLLNAMFEIK